MSAPIAPMVSTVSRSDSPFVVDDVPGLKVMTFAPRRWAARSKLSLVRVEGSKKASTTVRPVRMLP